jgi:transcriptional regulator with XRE-family HTH domain
VVTRERRLDRARRQAQRALALIGEEFRQARLQAGLTLEELGEAVGLSASEMSRIELGQADYVPYTRLALLAAALGLDLPLRAFPAGDPIRDAAQLALLAKLRGLLPTGLGWRTEVPLAIPGDLRAWDAVIEGRGWHVPVEAETRLRDVQAMSRRLALKQRDDRREIVILLVGDTRHNRHVLKVAGPDLAASFPTRGRAVLGALRNEERPKESGIVLL